MNVRKKDVGDKFSRVEMVHGYNHYIALDWSLDNATLARLSPSSSTPKVIRLNSNVKEIKDWAQKLRGRSILSIEETTGSHWLYVELKDYFSKILICDPYRNRLLSEGAKNDKADAIKLCQLLRSGMLKEVYHSVDEDYHLRKLVSYYEDWIKFGVRFQNQKSALYRSLGLQYKKEQLKATTAHLQFIDKYQHEALELYREGKKAYEQLFKTIRRKNHHISRLTSIAGISDISAVTIYSIVIDAGRFANKYNYWAYCGLVFQEKESGNRSYGRRRPRYNRKLKAVYKSAAVAAIGGKNDIREYYDHLVVDAGLSPWDARHAVARYIAKVSYAMLKNGTAYQPYQWRESLTKK